MGRLKKLWFSKSIQTEKINLENVDGLCFDYYITKDYDILLVTHITNIDDPTVIDDAIYVGEGSFYKSYADMNLRYKNHGFVDTRKIKIWDIDL